MGKVDKMKKINLPLDDKTLKEIQAGDEVRLTGTIYTARDQAHKRLVETLEAGKELPFEIKGSVIYYVGPAPNKPDKVIGSAGPTTSYRMDEYTPALLKKGLKGMIGKGPRSQNVINAIKENKAVYFAAIGGAAALLSKKIIESEVVAYPELQTEAIRLLKVKDFPLIVVNDIHGNDLYEMGKNKYKE